MTHCGPGPDWCLAPAGTLEEWMDDNGYSTEALASACAGDDPRRWQEAVTMIRDVLARRPLTQAHAALLAHAPGMPSAQFWVNFEADYRAGLAAGLTDVSGPPAEDGNQELPDWMITELRAMAAEPEDPAWHAGMQARFHAALRKMRTDPAERARIDAIVGEMARLDVDENGSGGSGS
jgi:hypothetical protein